MGAYFLGLMCLFIILSLGLCALWLDCWYHLFTSGVYILCTYLVLIISGIDIISGKSISVLSGGNDLHGLG